MELPPRFSPDNSIEARARRVAASSDFGFDHALAWLRLNERVVAEMQVEQYDVQPPHLSPGEVPQSGNDLINNRG